MVRKVEKAFPLVDLAQLRSWQTITRELPLESIKEWEPVTGEVAMVRSANLEKPLRLRMAVPFRLDSTFKAAGDSHGFSVAGESASTKPKKHEELNDPDSCAVASVSEAW